MENEKGVDVFENQPVADFVGELRLQFNAWMKQKGIKSTADAAKMMGMKSERPLQEFCGGRVKTNPSSEVINKIYTILRNPLAGLAQDLRITANNLDRVDITVNEGLLDLFNKCEQWLNFCGKSLPLRGR